MKFRTGPFEQTPQDLKRARAKMKPHLARARLHFGARARARRVFKPDRNFLEDSCYELPSDMIHLDVLSCLSSQLRIC